MSRCLVVQDVARVRLDAAQPLQPFALFALSHNVFLLEASPPAQVAAVVEHVVAVRVERPVAALARLLVVARHLDEALVQRQVVTDRVLPALLVLAVVRKPARVHARTKFFYIKAISLQDENDIVGVRKITSDTVPWS